MNNFIQEITDVTYDQVYKRSKLIQLITILILIKYQFETIWRLHWHQSQCIYFIVKTEKDYSEQVDRYHSYLLECGYGLAQVS